MHYEATVGIASGLLNLLPFLGLIAALALPLAAALLQFSTPGPYIVITLTILFLHVVSANLLIPKFIANRVSIGPVAATVGILFWGWLWGVMGLLLAVPLTAFIKLVADLHPSLCHLSNTLALTPRPTPRWVRYGETALERAIPYLRPVRKKFQEDDNRRRAGHEGSIPAIATAFLGGDPVCNLVQRGRYKPMPAPQGPR